MEKTSSVGTSTVKGWDHQGQWVGLTVEKHYGTNSGKEWDEHYSKEWD